MIEFIISLINLTKTAVYHSLLISSKIGQIIVLVLNTLIEVILTILKNFAALVIVIFEDFTIFTEDICQRIVNLSYLVCSFIETLGIYCSTTADAISGGVQILYTTLILSLTTIGNGISQISMQFGRVLVLMKKIIILFGDGVWFAITFIPLLTVYVITTFVYFLGTLLDEMKNMSNEFLKSICNFYSFMIDVPMESCLGLIAGFCIVYVLYKCHILVLGYSLQILENICSATRNIFVKYKIKLHRFFKRGNYCVRQGAINENNDCDTSQYCVVCKEHLKCILILPCRHVCLCRECNEKLRRYNRTCPICRNDIESTMKIFV